jgi:hypothetical protein
MNLSDRFSKGLGRLPMLAVLAAGAASATLLGGCNTYHYYDIDVKFVNPVTANQVSVMQLCLVDVSGAASDTVVLDCPPSKFPDMGTFEYATFADSGPITFTFNGFHNLPQSPSNQCTSAAAPLTASDEITQAATIMVTDFNDTNCPQMVTQ